MSRIKCYIVFSFYILQFYESGNKIAFDEKNEKKKDKGRIIQGMEWEEKVQMSESERE